MNVAHFGDQMQPEEVNGPLRPLRVLICVPSHGHHVSGFTRSVARAMAYFTAMPYGAEKALDIEIVNGSNLCEQRTVLVSKAYGYAATHILWADTDMKFPEDTIPRLLNHDKRVVGANYPQKTLDARPTAYRDDAQYVGPIWTKEASTGLEPASLMGLGLVLMDVSVFSEIELPYFLFEPQAPDNVKHLTEDYYLCKKLRGAGIEMFVDHDLSKQVAHVGLHDFTNSETEIAQEVKLKLYADLPL